MHVDTPFCNECSNNKALNSEGKAFDKSWIRHSALGGYFMPQEQLYEKGFYILLTNWSVVFCYEHNILKYIFVTIIRWCWYFIKRVRMYIRGVSLIQWDLTISFYPGYNRCDEIPSSMYRCITGMTTCLAVSNTRASSCLWWRLWFTLFL